MTEYIHNLDEKILNPILDVFKKDVIFVISFILAIGSCFIYTPKLNYINFKVLLSLFNLMLVVKAFEDVKILDMLAVTILNKCTSCKKVSLVLILVCFFSSMLVTNDVALLTFVPLTIIISKKASISMVDTVILQTLAANIGSSLTPMGNPQNLFIFSYYGINPSKFFITVIFFVILGGFWLYILNNRLKKQLLNISLSSIKVKSKIKVIMWSLLFFIIILSVLGFIDYKLAFIITLLTVLFFDKKLLLRIDYLLLITFVCFFIFIGNISNIKLIHTYIHSYLRSSTSVYFSSILLSQFISNVPSSILLASFTQNWKPLLLGVNIGGMGTIIASLASVISYKLFIKSNPLESKSYMIRFSIYNFLSLIILMLASYFVLEFLFI